MKNISSAVLLKCLQGDDSQDGKKKLKKKLVFQLVAEAAEICAYSSDCHRPGGFGFILPQELTI